MTNNLVDLASRREHKKEQQKEQRFKRLQARFEKALPSEEPDPKKKLLKLFKKKR